ncbi:DUF6572 domain-containing protein [Shewanella sp. HL-SH4]|jgi:hypothetical protein|uniref:DUF6572 domain-containing protein n=1 Tax=Shewanella TaxID=22 RepID=UPI001CF88DA6|nr:DUF6572 domain-containing protein [Shewanella glacialimarina]UCX05128.1 hypothetical protein FJ709_11840 [Shewanella glacialimarina]
MAITETNKIDSVVSSKEHNEVVLLITDHLDWSDDLEHQQLLQAKINSYIRFIESGQLCEEFPEDKGKQVSIVVACAFELNDTAKKFYERVNNFLKEKLSIEIKYTMSS